MRFQGKSKNCHLLYCSSVICGARKSSLSDSVSVLWFWFYCRVERVRAMRWCRRAHIWECPGACIQAAQVVALKYVRSVTSYLAAAAAIKALSFLVSPLASALCISALQQKRERERDRFAPSCSPREQTAETERKTLLRFFTCCPVHR